MGFLNRLAPLMMRRLDKTAVAVCAVALVAVCACVIPAVSSARTAAGTLADAAAVRAEAKETEGQKTVTAEDTEAMRETAHATAKAVADLQNEYRGKTGDGAELGAIAEKMDAYLAPGNEYSRVPWFGTDDGSVTLSWKASDIVIADGDTCEVTWLLVDGDGKIYAYAHGEIDSDGLITSVRRGVTQNGGAVTPASEG